MFNAGQKNVGQNLKRDSTSLSKRLELVGLIIITCFANHVHVVNFFFFHFKSIQITSFTLSFVSLNSTSSKNYFSQGRSLVIKIKSPSPNQEEKNKGVGDYSIFSQ